jgi:hypothetical protein
MTTISSFVLNLKPPALLVNKRSVHVAEHWKMWLNTGKMKFNLGFRTNLSGVVVSAVDFGFVTSIYGLTQLKFLIWDSGLVK